jgi:hypothetical protein
MNRFRETGYLDTTKTNLFPAFTTPRKTDEMITTAAIKTLEALKRIALLELAIGPGMRTAICVYCSYGVVLP